MEQNEIYMIRGTDYKQMTIQLLEELDLAQDIGDRKKLVGIKPNLLSHYPSAAGGRAAYISEAAGIFQAGGA